MTSTVDQQETQQRTRRDRSRRVRRLSRRDKIVLALMVGIPTLAHLVLVWVPTIASVVLSFTDWNGIGLDSIKFVGLKNYEQLFTNYPAFWPALEHNFLWLAFFLVIPTPFGIFLAYQLNKQIRGSRFYQTAIFLPMVISLAVVGFIWEIIYNPDTGLINGVLGTNVPGHYIDWLGNPKLNLWAVLVAASWRHAAYIMVLYLAGLKGMDPALPEAAAIDGASEWQAFTRVTFPSMKPINIIVAVVTVIESLRAFDLVYVMGGNNGTKPGLELLSLLITNNILGESPRIGFGSAIAVVLLVISLIVIIPYLVQTFRKERVR
ncbi:MAG TPA: sugar ABC transporter permease [Pseudonocardiaceae bacterium]|jgi:multiple sugar transport system permease protein/raffinose/stachyose/melibiose transport system permease protein